MTFTVAPAPEGYAQFHMQQVVEALRTAFNASSAGEVIFHAGTPADALLCDGSAVSRVAYEGLFAVIGTTYGVGDGSTTFNVPTVADLTVSNGTDARAWIRT